MSSVKGIPLGAVVRFGGELCEVTAFITEPAAILRDVNTGQYHTVIIGSRIWDEKVSGVETIPENRESPTTLPFCPPRDGHRSG